jgi:Domain of Unknown Function (DUF326)
VSYGRQLLDTYPGTFNVDAGVLAATIHAIIDRAQACTSDADDDLGEHDVGALVKCIRLCQDCDDVCTASVRVIGRQTEYDANVTRPLLEACAAACRSCGDECERHARIHQHCRVCAEACRRCEQAGRELLPPWNRNDMGVSAVASLVGPPPAGPVCVPRPRLTGRPCMSAGTTPLVYKRSVLTAEHID